jgi:hypothetical protein
VEEKFLARADVQNDGFTPRLRQRELDRYIRAEKSGRQG